MKKTILALIVTMATPIVSAAGDSYMSLKKVKHFGEDHIFVYQCNQTGNAIEVEQRYNHNSKAEEIRFITNHKAGEWITKEINPKTYRYFGEKSCEESTTELVSVL